MYCSRCGAPLVPEAAFCAKCGAAVVRPAAPPVFDTPAPATSAVVIKRPLAVTILAVLQFIGAAFWLLAVLGSVAGSSLSADAAPAIVIAPVFIGIGLAQLFCGLGLLRLKPYGRTLQLVFAWIGLIGIPIGTIISILILIYFFRPGVKLIFAGRPGDDFTPQEAAEIKAEMATSSAMVVIVVVVAVLVMIGFIAILAAIAVPGLLRARTAGNEASAIASLRAIKSAEVVYAAGCAQGGYAVALDDLAKPPQSGGGPFITPDLGHNGVEKSGYIMTVTRDRSPVAGDVGSPAATCNGSTGQPASSYFATAEPVSPGASGLRYFAVDGTGTIYQSMSPIANPIMNSSGVTPIR